MSPVQPSRSSRCGQSVGTSRKLPFCPHTELLTSWFTPAWEHWNQPTRFMSECTTTASRSSGGQLAGEAGDLGVAEAVECEGRFKGVVSAGQDEGVGGLGGPQRAGAQFVVFEHL